MKKTLVSLLAAGAVCSANADVITTKDGARLTGTVTLIDKGVVHLTTDYAGTLQVNQELISTIETEAPLTVRTDTGSVASGPVRSAGSERLTVQSADGNVTTNARSIASAWGLDARDPEVVRNERKWKSEIGLDLFGKNGNSDEFSVGAFLDATLKGPNDTLNFYGSYSNREQNDLTTSDETKIGASYDNFFSKIVGWYVRTELEVDDIEQIDLRSTSGAGLSYRIIDKDIQNLVFRTGVGYRHTSFTNGADDESTATLDFGINHHYEMSPWLSFDNELVYVPSVDDFDNYTLVHDSSVTLPFGGSQNWSLRAGITHEYASQTQAAERLDTTYYTRIVYSFK